MITTVPVSGEAMMKRVKVYVCVLGEQLSLVQCPYALVYVFRRIQETKNKRWLGEIGGDDDVVSISSLLKLGVAPASVFICASWRQGWLGGMATVVANLGAWTKSTWLIPKPWGRGSGRVFTFQEHGS